jgi:hypothetical protein
LSFQHNPSDFLTLALSPVRYEWGPDVDEVCELCPTVGSPIILPSPVPVALADEAREIRLLWNEGGDENLLDRVTSLFEHTIETAASSQTVARGHFHMEPRRQESSAARKRQSSRESKRPRPKQKKDQTQLDDGDDDDVGGSGGDKEDEWAEYQHQQDWEEDEEEDEGEEDEYQSRDLELHLTLERKQQRKFKQKWKRQ